MTTRMTFVWSPDLGAQRSVAPNVQQTKFGDGYEVRVAKGVNYTPKSWSLQFSCKAVIAKDIISFLEGRGGIESFTWTDPFNETATYVCRKWDMNQQMFGVYVITATFEQVYEY